VADQPAQHWLNFDQAVQHVRESGKAAFASAPVFGEDDETAEGARVFLIESAGGGGIQFRYIAGPFFANGFAANDVLQEGEIPDRVRELQFMPTTFSEDWLSDQMQVLVSRLVRAAGIAAPEMPDYVEAPARGAPAEVAIPIERIGRGSPKRGRGDS